MRRQLLVFVLGVLLAYLGSPARADQDQLEHLVLTPADYAASERSYPVVYVVPGSAETPDSATTNMGLQAYADTGALVVVVAEVGDGESNFIVDWFDGSKPLDTAFVDLVGQIDVTYRTLADGAHRGIFGWSAGGYSATAIASRHPELFATVASFSGVTDITLASPAWPLAFEAINAFFSGPESAFRRWGNPVTDDAYWRANNPADLAANLAGKQGVYISAGDGTPATTDEALSHGVFLGPSALIEHLTWQMTRSYHTKLDAASVPHTYRPRTGTHIYEHWRADLAEWWPVAMDVIG